MQEHKKMNRDSTDCWLQLVKVAKWHQLVFQQSLAKLTKYFKPRAKPPPIASMLCIMVQLSHSPALLSLLDDSRVNSALSDFDDDPTALSSDIDPS